MDASRRIMALWLPRLPTDRLIRRDAALCDAPPLVISARNGNALEVHALCARAQKLGLHKGQPLAVARAMTGALTVVPAAPQDDAALLERIADWCDRFTPFVALDASDGLLLDITGAAHLFGGEAAMLALVTRKIADQGFAVRAAIAGTSLAARALARFAQDRSAPPGTERAAMTPLPVAALDCGEAALRALRRAGLKTIGDVAARGRSELAERFGKDFIARLEIFLGRAEKPLTPRRHLPDLMAERRFAEPVTSEAAIASALFGLAQSLGEVLEERGLGLRLLEAVFFRADGAVRRLAVRLGAPLRDPHAMMRLLREKIDALADPLDPGFGFDVIRLEAALTEETQPAAISFDANDNARQQVDFLIDRLSARFGSHNVLRFLRQDTHIPEAQSVALPAQERDITGQDWARKRQADDPPLRPLRLLSRPEEISVSFATVPDGAPPRFAWRRARFEVLHAEGPERIAMEWWRSALPTRDYFRVETREGLRFWLYRDGLYDSGLKPRWYLQGVFS